MEPIDLSEFLKTKQEANAFSSKLSTVADCVYHNGFNLEKTLSEELGITKKDKFMALINENNIDTSSNAPLLEFLDKIRKSISSMPVVSLKLAFEPGEETLNALSEWFIINTKKQVLFDIQYDPSLIAGCSVNYNGKHADYSIKPQFSEVLKKLMPTLKIKQQNTTQPIQHQSIEHITFGR